MADPGPGTLVLFVGGDPAIAEWLASFPTGFPRWKFLIPPAMSLVGSPPGPVDPQAPWPVPIDQLMCLERLSTAVKGSGLTVKIVDVNRPGEDRPLVEKYVSAGDILPILLRQDGARLEGYESFTPDALRKFVLGR